MLCLLLVYPLILPRHKQTVIIPLSSYLATACLLWIRGPKAYIVSSSPLSSSFQAIFIALFTPKQKPALSAINIFFNLNHPPLFLLIIFCLYQLNTILVFVKVVYNLVKNLLGNFRIVFLVNFTIIIL